MDIKLRQLRDLKKKRGVALLIVLLALTLLAVLIVGIVLSAGFDVKTASDFASGERTRMLADSVVNRVETQIQAATRGADSSNNVIAWASQPGMVRTFDTSGNLINVYRLYSASNPITSAASFSAANEVPPNNWDTTPELYTDLNAPQTSGGQTIYPIVDPSAQGTVEGFSYSLGSLDTTTSNPLPMPTQWLYVLQDGSMVPGTSKGNNQVTVAGASASNPIVGRVAFWTDDDTCKININTAAGTDWTTATTLSSTTAGAFWDQPRGDTNFERTLATSIPQTNEFQRYPGHPASTCLSAVFPTLSSTDIYNLVPRIVGGGSNQGTGTATPGTPPLVNDQDRLYANVDEMFYQPNRTAFAPSAITTAAFQAQLEPSRFFLTAHSVSPDLNVFNLPRISMWPQPDPANTNPATATINSPSIFDSLTAFASTLGATGTTTGYPYYFSRYNPYSQTADLPTTATATGVGRNRTLMEYLRTLTGLSIPGFGGKFRSKYGGVDSSTVLGGQEIDEILAEIFDYIRVTNLEAITEKLDGTPPLNPNAYSHNGLVLPIQDKNIAPPTEGFGRYITLREVGLLFYGMADYMNGGPQTVDGTAYKVGPYPPGYAPAYATPTNNLTKPANTRPSSFNTVGAQVPVNSTLSVPFNSGSNVNVVRVRPVLVFNLTMPAANNSQLCTASQGGAAQDFQIQISGLDQLSWSGGGSIVNMFSGGTVGVTSTVLTSAANMLTPVAGNIGTMEPSSELVYSSKFGSPYAMDISRGGNGTFTFSGGTIKVAIYDPRVSTTAPIQTISVNFPLGSFPVPSLSPLCTSGTLTYDFRDFDARSGYSFPSFVCDHDVIRTLTVRNPNADTAAYANDPNYDFRLVAPRSTINTVDNLFGASPNYGTATTAFAASLSSLSNSGGIYNGMEVGCYAPNISPMEGCDYHWSILGNSSTGNPAESIAIPSDGLTAAPGQVTTPTSLYSMVYNVTKAGANNTDSNDNQTYGLQDTVSSFPGSANRYSVNLISSTRRAYINPVPVSSSSNPTQVSGGVVGDWDNGFGAQMDGPFINKADDGQVLNGTTMPWYGENTVGGGASNAPVPLYATSPTGLAPTTGYYAPNCMVPSSMMLGSLPTGIEEKLPWQTLLFRPGPSGHPGLGTPVNATSSTVALAPPYTSPPDHLIADLFNMPIVQPYPITTPLATGGQINMNYQIMPFSYITRATGVEAVLATERMSAIPNNESLFYKISSTTHRATGVNYRTLINLAETLKGFQQRFTAGDIFRSASEICSLWLVPTGSTFQAGFPTGFDAWRTGYYLTGDNSLEKPYADIYPRLTTKSNTYTVHYRVQSLKIIPGADPTIWNENQDVVVSELRGSTSIERYIDPNDAWLSTNDLAADVVKSGSAVPVINGGSPIVLGDHYRFRVLANRRFSVIQ